MIINKDIVDQEVTRETIPTRLDSAMNLCTMENNLIIGKKVIIFDLDGTLIDSVGIWNEVDKILIRKLTNNDQMKIHNIHQKRDNVLSLSKTDNIYLEYCDFLRREYNLDMPAEEILDLRTCISDEYTKNQVDYKPKADELLHILNDMGYILALATTTTTKQLDLYRNLNKNMKDKANMDSLFQVILTQDDVNEKKPSPEVHNKIMKLLQINPSECLIIEDSLVGVQAGKNAGIDVAVLYDKYSDTDRKQINELADYKFNSFDEIIKSIY